MFLIEEFSNVLYRHFSNVSVAYQSSNISQQFLMFMLYSNFPTFMLYSNFLMYRLKVPDEQLPFKVPS